MSDQISSTSLSFPCPQWAEKLAMAHPADLKPEDQDALDAHLATCTHCRAVRDEYQSMDTLIAARFVEPLSEGQLEYCIESNSLPARSHEAGTTVIFPTRRTRYVMRQNRLLHIANSLAAVLIVGLLISGTILLFHLHRSSTGSMLTTCLPDPHINSFYASGGIGGPAPITIASSQVYVHNSHGDVTAFDSNNGLPLRAFSLEGMSIAQLTIVNDTMYAIMVVGKDGRALYALRTGDSAVLWHQSVSTLSVASPPIVAEGTVYVTGIDSILHAFRASDGTPVQTIHLPGQISEPFQILNGIIYGQGYVAGENALYALRLSDKKVLWISTTNSWIGPPAIFNGMIYTTNHAGDIAVLRASDGHSIRTYSPGASVHFNTGVSPAGANNIIYAVSSANIVYALRADTGAGLWCTTVKSSPNVLSPTLVHAIATLGNAVYVTTEDGHLYAYDTISGKSLWHYHFTGYEDSGGILLSPVLQNDKIYVATTREIVVLAASSGKVVWRQSTH